MDRKQLLHAFSTVLRPDGELNKATGGAMIFLMVVLTLAKDVSGPWLQLPDWLAGAPGWLAALILIANVSIVQRWQAAVIGVCGVLLLFTAFHHGIRPRISTAIANNSGLISMIAAVGFLRLIAAPGSRDDTLPQGPGAYLKTILGVSLFGAVINISAPIIFSDRLYSAGALSRLASQSITRIFSGCSAWSPFFGGMAVVLTYVPDLSLAFVMICCLPFAMAGFALVYTEARLRYAADVAKFRGYPVQFSSLWIPAVLAVMVVMFSRFVPGWSILTCISVSALGLTVFVLLVRQGLHDSIRTLYSHITRTLPGMINELLLFLVAGVLAAGLASVIAGELVSVQVFEFRWVEAMMLTGAMVLASVIGVHPVVTVSGATPMILALDPDPNLLAVAYLLAWSLGTCGSPLSGTHLVFQGRYGIPGWRGAFWNLPYVTVMFVLAIPLLIAVDRLVI